MEGLREYILSIIATAVICSIATCLLGSKGTAASVAKMLTGIILVIAVVRPLADLRFDSWEIWNAEINRAAADAARDGEEMAYAEVADIIKTNLEAYILDKAEAMNADLAVEVMLDDASIPQPDFVRISGSISPYAKQKLSQIIEDELAIAKENQLWTG